MKHHDRVAAALADALLTEPHGAKGFADKASAMLGQKHLWMDALARKVYRRFGSDLSDISRERLIEFIRDGEAYRKWRVENPFAALHYALTTPVMKRPVSILAEIALPELPAPGDLAAWLGITIPELEWYADIRGMIRSTDGPLCHYHYTWIPKPSGGYRLIESPKARLCAIQQKILHDILDHVPAHAAAHGFRRDHSCLTYAEPHLRKLVVLRMDLRNFFGSIPAGRVSALFKSLGYPEATARFLTGLCTNRVSTRVMLNIPGADLAFRMPWRERNDLGTPHLPQGAPTSPALANLCALHLDFRLEALAESMAANYTRYADDLAFSGNEEVRRCTKKLPSLIAAIALEEGFEINFRKTRVMHKSDRQFLTGIIVNDKTNMHRKEYDRLKAILHNCRRFGPHSQNREGHRDFHAHMLGRVNHLKRLNQQRGAKLQAILERIQW